MSEQQLVLQEKRGAVSIVTINRPEKRNALNGALRCALLGALDTAARDTGVRVVVLTGAGDKAFVAGADIAEMQEMPPDQAERLSSRGAAIGRLIEKSRLVWIAVVNGFALGGGCELAMCCDFIYASSSARFGQPEAKLGVIPGFGGTQRLARRVGIGKAKELVLTGDMVGAEEALRIGLCEAVFPPNELMGKAREAALRIAANGPLAVAEAKRVIQKGLDEDLDEGLALETAAFAGLFESGDQKEGMAAFVAKRPAAFKGS